MYLYQPEKKAELHSFGIIAIISVCVVLVHLKNVI